MIPENKICIRCGVNKKPKYGKKYCLECRKEVEKEQHKSYVERHKKKRYCRVCGVELSGAKHYKFCSDECYNLVKREYDRVRALRRARRYAQMWKKLSDDEQLKRMQQYMIERLR